MKLLFRSVIERKKDIFKQLYVACNEMNIVEKRFTRLLKSEKGDERKLFSAWKKEQESFLFAVQFKSGLR